MALYVAWKAGQQAAHLRDRLQIIEKRNHKEA